ncbi:probable methyltransferase PMT26 [Henckelia pumila]|uniref:probable methyltransferase PMT26 n=1 Tax=Henckelia pumila TaxID=405737 RepID=UPI003C6DFB81
MASGKYSRVDGRRSSWRYCSTVTIMVFVALCIVGVWMMTTSSMLRFQNTDVSAESENKLKIHTTDSNSENNDDDDNHDNSSNGVGGSDELTDDGKSNQFEDNRGNLTENVSKGDTARNSNQEEKNEISEDNETDTKEKKEDKSKGSSKDENTEDGSENESENGDDGKSQMAKKATETIEMESNADDLTKESEKNSNEKNDGKRESQIDGSVVINKDEELDQDSFVKDKSVELLPSGSESEILDESSTQNGSFLTQATESANENEAQKSSQSENQNVYSWKLCNTTSGPDFIPCLDNWAVIRKLPSTKHYEHRERHCPDNPPTCLVPVPEGYQPPIEWPTSREKIWYHNVPHTKLVEIKGHQNWVKVSGEYLIFPGGGTQFKHGALHYIDFIQESVPDIAWGNHSRVVLDVGCGVASFGGYLFEKDVLTMSLAPKDEHEAQVQFALERGIPAISAVMGTKRLPYPGRVFDVVHCARCRVPWHIEGGKLLLELNRLLRPGGFFVWSATPIYQKLPDDIGIWEAMKKLTKAMCWEVVSISKDEVNRVGLAVYRKPTSNECYEQRSQNDPPLCQNSDDPNAAWNVPLKSCMHKVPVALSDRGSQWPEQWPARAEKTPYWLLTSQVGAYGKPAPEDFVDDNEHWKRVVNKSYLNGLGIKWSSVRNVMDMRAIYGGFAAALRELNLWVMNIVSIDAPDTLPIIYERGLFGIYHDWCESFSTYPRSYDLLHADHIFSKIKARCNIMALVSEVNRILRPEGNIIVRDTVKIISELENIFKSMRWDIRMTYSKNEEGMLCAQKTMWRPKDEETVKYAIA